MILSSISMASNLTLTNPVCNEETSGHNLGGGEVSQQL
jgi:hypothetical protein